MGLKSNFSKKKLFNIPKPWTQCSSLSLLPTASATEETLSLEPDTLTHHCVGDAYNCTLCTFCTFSMAAAVIVCKLCFPVQLDTTKRASCSIQSQAANSC